MTTGKIKWYNADKGYGFIAQDNGDEDLFLHSSEVQEANLSDLKEGQKLSFKVISKHNNKKAATDISII